ncbi:hypothetical protein HPG69_018160 [Diceros bicornis minor]|uniref:Uncharacterized protein n=1 Tax=Diceros bicornis minor TaxID=77932 RepID=A0A7J7FLZ4_DICBM|nr:hypothetical protein HPG69_018160 [Diceros bicornis minor]
MLDAFAHEMDHTQSRMDGVLRKTAKVSHMTSASVFLLLTWDVCSGGVRGVGVQDVFLGVRPQKGLPWDTRAGFRARVCRDSLGGVVSTYQGSWKGALSGSHQQPGCEPQVSPPEKGMVDPSPHPQRSPCTCQCEGPEAGVAPGRPPGPSEQQAAGRLLQRRPFILLISITDTLRFTFPSAALLLTQHFYTRKRTHTRFSTPETPRSVLTDLRSAPKGPSLRTCPSQPQGTDGGKRLRPAAGRDGHRAATAGLWNFWARFLAIMGSPAASPTPAPGAGTDEGDRKALLETWKHWEVVAGGVQRTPGPLRVLRGRKGPGACSAPRGSGEGGTVVVTRTAGGCGGRGERGPSGGWRRLWEGLCRGAGLAVVAGRLEAVLHAHHVRVHLARVADEGGVGVALGREQLELGHPALAHDAPGVGAHVGRNGVHLALLEVGGKALAVVCAGRAAHQAERGLTSRPADRHWALQLLTPQAHTHRLLAGEYRGLADSTLKHVHWPRARLSPAACKGCKSPNNHSPSQRVSTSLTILNTRPYPPIRANACPPQPHPSPPPESCTLTLDGVEDATVQRFASGVVGGRSDAGATAVGQRVPGAGVGVGRSGPCGGGEGMGQPHPRPRPGLTGQRRRPGGAAAGPCAAYPR